MQLFILDSWVFVSLDFSQCGQKWCHKLTHLNHLELTGGWKEMSWKRSTVCLTETCFCLLLLTWLFDLCCGGIETVETPQKRKLTTTVSSKLPSSNDLNRLVHIIAFVTGRGHRNGLFFYIDELWLNTPALVTFILYIYVRIDIHLLFLSLRT